jgi:catechol 2,3-dioxygenase-like lactoylglutathione lyase family enzyme
MARVFFGNHSAIRVNLSERDRIRKFYCEILGGKIIREFEGKDDICIGDNFYIAFLYKSGDGRGADKGVNYAAENALSDEEFLKAIFLELKADDLEEVRQKIVDFGVRVIDVPDPHLYFQAPGGQVFRLVGINEELSQNESDS